MNGQEWDRVAELLHEVGHLSRTARSGYALLRQPGQSVAAHSFRVAFIALVLADQGEVDLARVLTMCLVHDLPEARTTDLHHLAKSYVQVDEPRVLHDQTEGLPMADRLREAHTAYCAHESNESRLVKDADQLELLLSLKERDPAGSSEEIDHWVDNVLDRLETQPGRELAKAIQRGDVDSWWTRRGSSC